MIADFSESLAIISTKVYLEVIVKFPYKPQTLNLFSFFFKLVSILFTHQQTSEEPNQVHAYLEADEKTHIVLTDRCSIRYPGLVVVKPDLAEIPCPELIQCHQRHVS